MADMAAITILTCTAAGSTQHSSRIIMEHRPATVATTPPHTAAIMVIDLQDCFETCTTDYATAAPTTTLKWATWAVALALADGPTNETLAQQRTSGNEMQSIDDGSVGVTHTHGVLFSNHFPPPCTRR